MAVRVWLRGRNKSGRDGMGNFPSRGRDWTSIAFRRMHQVEFWHSNVYHGRLALKKISSNHCFVRVCVVAARHCFIQNNPHDLKFAQAKSKSQIVGYLSCPSHLAQNSLCVPGPLLNGITRIETVESVEKEHRSGWFISEFDFTAQ